MNWKQGILALAAVGLLLLLYFAPKNQALNKDVPEESEGATKFELATHVDSLKLHLPSELKQKLTDAENAGELDSVITLWNAINKPVAAAFYSKKKAEKEQSSVSWQDAGDYFIISARLTQGHELKKSVYENATECFEKALELDPKNLDAKTGLGVCYVESAQFTGEAPMKGIGVLKSVIAEDPNNTKALMNLGYFAFQSGQLDLAIERFEKVLEIDPTIHESLLYLAEISLKQDNKEIAISYLEQYRGSLSDQMMVEEVTRYIEEIKTKN